MSAPPAGKIYVVLVNWNGWRDTIECLESLLGSDYPQFEAVVCDNGSTDGSVERLGDWADGRLGWAIPASSPVRQWAAAPQPKPVPCRVVAQRAAAASAVGASAVGASAAASGTPPPRVTIIAAGENRGFSAGVNVGLRYAVSQGDLAFAWLLNNDTVVTPTTMRALVSAAPDPDVPVICGGTILHYDAPDTVQSFGGGSFLAVAGRPRLIGAGASGRDPLPAPAEIEPRLAYVSGSSMFVSRRFIEAAGFLDESYFLYFEELDWIHRMGGAARLRYAPAARIFHKVGASAGTATRGRWPSPFSEYHFQRSRIRFTRRFYPYALPAVGGVMLLQAFRWILRGERALARAVVCALFARPFPPAGNARERAAT
jgi:GT2 family glycosyltransferase